MAKNSQIKTIIMQRLTPLAKTFGLALIDVEMVREQEKKILRLIVDKKGGVSIDDCVAMSEAADPIVANELEITDHDIFEVESAGLNRNLTETVDLLRHTGADIDVKLYKASSDGRKVVEGVLEAVDDEAVSLRMKDGSLTKIARKDAATIRRGIRF